MSYWRGSANEGIFLTIRTLGSGYACTMRGWRDPYGRNEFDFVAVYLVLEDLWYIIPAKHVLGKWCIALCPHSRKAKYDPYREAWHLLRGESPKSGRVRTIQACADEWFPCQPASSAVNDSASLGDLSHLSGKGGNSALPRPLLTIPARSSIFNRNRPLLIDQHWPLRYMHENPVRRGLVAAPEEWRWSSFRAYAYQEPGLHLHPGELTLVFHYEVVARHLAKWLGHLQSVFRRHGHEAHLGPFPAPLGVLDLYSRFCHE